MRLNYYLVTGIFVAIFIAKILVAASETSNYTIKDLSILAEELSYEEFLIHAKDIKPSERNSEWISLVHKMSNGYVVSRITKEDYSIKTFEYIEHLFTTWPVIRRSEQFSLERIRYASTFFIKYKKTATLESCIAILRKFWENTPASTSRTDFGVFIAKNFELPEDLKTMMLHDSLFYKFSEIYCKEEITFKHIFSKLRNIIEQQNNISSEEIKKLANDQCINTIIPPLKNVIKEAKPDVRLIGFLTLKALKQLSDEDYDHFYTYYLLQAPVIGDTFNEAWNRVNSLAMDYKRRQHVYQVLAQEDPLPGMVFNWAPDAKQATLLDHLIKNLPEYFDSYAQTCLDYYEGRKVFPNGNPTLECRQFFANHKIREYVGKNKISRFEKIKL